jgi:Mce-associated membrane protein
MKRMLRGRQHIVSLVVGAVTVVALGLAVAAWVSADRSRDSDSAAGAALGVANAATAAIFSYDYRSFDASVANGQQFVTGDFATEYAQTTAALQASAIQEQAVVRAEVSAAGVIDASADQVEILLYVNQYRRNVNVDGEKVDQNRVVLTLVPVDGHWRVSHALAI